MKKQAAMQRLFKCLKLGEGIKAIDLFDLSFAANNFRGSGSGQFMSWKRGTLNTIKDVFGEASPHLKDFEDALTPTYGIRALSDSPMVKARNLLAHMIKEVDDFWEADPDGTSTTASAESPAQHYVDPQRIAEIEAIKCQSFDLSKLVALCKELNATSKTDSYYALIMLTRAVLDHVPPIFGCKSFAEVTNNYKGGRSFSELASRLELASRKIADAHLHRHIRNREPPINRTQVTFSNELDVLLQEIVHILG